MSDTGISKKDRKRNQDVVSIKKKHRDVVAGFVRECKKDF